MEDPVIGYTEFERGDDGVTAVAHRQSGASERVSVRVSVEREHRNAAGELIASGEVASTDDGSVKVA